MAGCLNITSLDSFYIRSLFIFLHCKYFIHHGIQVMKNQKYKNKEKMKRGQKQKQERQGPMSKRETNSESVQAQMPLLLNTLLVSQIV